MIEHRLSRLRALLDEQKLGALFVSDPFSRRYLSGFTGSNGWLLIGRDQAIIATDFRYYEQSAAQAPEFRLHKTVGGFDGWVPSLFAGLGGKKVAFEAGDMTVGVHSAFKKAIAALPEAERGHATSGGAMGLRCRLAISQAPDCRTRTSVTR